MPDGNRLVSGSDDGVVNLWNIDNLHYDSIHHVIEYHVPR